MNKGLLPEGNVHNDISDTVLQLAVLPALVPFCFGFFFPGYHVILSFVVFIACLPLRGCTFCANKHFCLLGSLLFPQHIEEYT